MDKQEVIKKIKETQFGARVSSDGEKDPETKGFYRGYIKACEDNLNTIKEMPE